MAWREVADIHQRDADPSWCEKMPRKLFGWTRNTSVKVSPGQTLSSIPALIYISLSPIVKWVCQDQRSSGFSGSNLGCSMFIQFWSMSSWVYRNAQSWFLSQEPNSRDFPVHPVPWSPEYRSCKPSSNPVDHSILHLAQELDTSVTAHVYRNSLLKKKKKHQSFHGLLALLPQIPCLSYARTAEGSKGLLYLKETVDTRTEGKHTS